MVLSIVNSLGRSTKPLPTDTEVAPELFLNVCFCSIFRLIGRIIPPAQCALVAVFWAFAVRHAGPATEDFFRLRLGHMIDQRHPLAVRASRIPWQELEARVAQVLAQSPRGGGGGWSYRTCTSMARRRCASLGHPTLTDHVCRRAS